jgi:hypothetical protein
MRTDPFSDTVMWLTDVRFVVVIYWALLVGSAAVAAINWTLDPAQRTGENVAVWGFRLLIGGMWYQGTTWKLPLPYSDAFKFWLEETGKHAAFPIIADLVTGVMLPLIVVFGTLIYFVELFLATTITLGVLTRLGALIAMGQGVFLWLGLYHAEKEWPWNYIFLIVLHGLFFVYGAGRSLGVDALLRRPGGVFDRATGLRATVLRLAT